MLRRILPLLPSLLLLGVLDAATPKPPDTPAGARELQQRVGELYDPLVRATVAIFCEGVQGAGSGVIVSPDGLVMTAAHVVDAPGKKLSFLLSDGTIATGVALGVDHSTDAALARIDGPGPFPFRPHAAAATYAVADWALATGHPGGPVIGRPAPLRIGKIITAGQASGFSDPIVTDCTVISGDSGGPLFNLDGEVIGIHSNVAGPWTSNQHVPLPAFLNHWDEFLNGKHVPRKEVGAGGAPVPKNAEEFLREMTQQHRELLKAHPEQAGNTEQLERPALRYPHEMQPDFERWAPQPETRRCAGLGLRFDPASRQPRVATVVPDSPAARAGIQPGDRIVAAAGQDGVSLVDLIQLINDTEPNASLVVKIERAGTITTASLTTGTRFARRDFSTSSFGVLSHMPMVATKAAAKGAGRMNPELMKGLTPFAAPAAHSVVAILRDQKKVALATVIDGEGHLVTKASEIGDDGELVCMVGTERRALTRIGSDKDTDLALLRTDAAGLTPVTWADAPVQPGRLLFGAAPGAALKTVSVVSRPPAPCPATGFEFPNLPDIPPTAGIMLDPDADGALVQVITTDGAADRAGIREGDVILRFNGNDMANGEALSKAVAACKPGQKLAVVVKRGEQELPLHIIMDQPFADATQPSSRATSRDSQIEQLSNEGGKLNQRRRGFPLCIFHDAMLDATTCGSPLLDTEGKAVGIDIARTLRTRSLALPASEVLSAVKRIRGGVK